MKTLIVTLTLALTGCAGFDLDDDTSTTEREDRGRDGDGSADDSPGDVQGDECTLDADCGPDLECEDGFCAPHGGDGDEDGEHHGGDDDGAGGGGGDDGAGGGGGDDSPGDVQGDECSLDADCGPDLECEDGFCVPHGGD